MSSLTADRKPPLDYGVQIRFIKDLDDTGGGFPDRSRVGGGGVTGGGRTPPPSRYGVAVRVQGISGQPYVVLKDGEKGDSYGVQLKAQSQAHGTTSGRSSPFTSLPLAQRDSKPYQEPRPAVDTPGSTDEEPVEAFGSPSKRPPGDGQAGSQVEGEGQVAEMVPNAKPSVSTNVIEKQETGGLNEAGLRKVGPKPKGVGPKEANFSGKSQFPIETFPEPPPPISFNEEPVPAIDTKSLAPINKLISKFNSGSPSVESPVSTGGQTQPRDRSRARARLHFDERHRSHSLEACEDQLPNRTPPVSPSSSPSPTFNPYAPPTPTANRSQSSSSSSLSSIPAYNSLGHKSPSVAKATTVTESAPAIFSQAPRNFVPKDTPPALPKKPMSPEIGKSSGHSLSLTNGDLYNTTKYRPNVNDSLLKRKPNSSLENFGDTKVSLSGMESSLKENLSLEEQLEQSQRELKEAKEELVQLRMEKDRAESRLHQQEDQLAELQEDLRRVSENSPQMESVQTELMSVRAELAEATMLRQNQEETLRQRERELTALKGVLKEEVATHDHEIEALKEQFSQDMETLRQSMENVSQTQLEMEEERQKVNTSIMTLQQDLKDSKEQGLSWKKQLQSISQELLQVQSERKEDEETLKQELRTCHNELRELEEKFVQQRAELQKKEEGLNALKAATDKREVELKAEFDSWKDQSQQEKHKLERALETAKQSLMGSEQRLQNQESNKEANLELQEVNARLRERLNRRTRMQPSVPLSSEAEEALEEENRALKMQLEEARRGASRLCQERDELNRQLEEREREREALRRGKSELEEQKRLLDRALEKINKEMELLMGDSRQSVQILQAQLDEYRDRSRRELQESQRQSKERLTELQRAQASIKALQEEVSRLKRELLTSTEDRDSAQLDRDLLNSRLKHLESELDTERSSQTDRSREIRNLEDKIKSLEIELDEEKSGTELLNDRITRSREQSDQLRSDLMQERSARHDLEMDKSALERQVKDLRSRVADMEGQSRPSTGVTLLENKVQELEERLRSEEREKSGIQASLRRMERKLKDLNATLDEERHQYAEQRDQLSLRVKALKRQLDESEGEVERLEGVRRKNLREVEEQQERQEVLQAKVTALEGEIKRKMREARRPTLGPSSLSSEEEDGFYDNGSSFTEGL
ncbi:cingulin isoform X2 [Denticeps clupeoides]|uniref:Myosin tail domain-containing protein n=1 Tax=Denticeps clupeoides TaxID=299321 RepID=A0AAY4DAK5_9TELE|nr:cingulin-like isoform X2 [Denticeps clupeoides]